MPLDFVANKGADMADESLDEQLAFAAAQHALGAEKRQALRKLEREVVRLTALTEDLAALAQKEEADVKALESSRLRMLGYALLGTRQQHLQQEQDEARQAEQDLAAAQQQLEALLQQKSALEAALADDDELYLSLLSEKTRLIL
jgi:vacuolar-type H+-ATPase subunit F/Vma7